MLVADVGARDETVNAAERAAGRDLHLPPQQWRGPRLVRDPWRGIPPISAHQKHPFHRLYALSTTSGSRLRMILAGAPAAMQLPGRSFVTTLIGNTTVRSPRVTPG